MLLIAIIAVIFFAAALCFFIKSSAPKTFDQMPESTEPEPPATEYFDHIKIVPTGNMEPTIHKTISL